MKTVPEIPFSISPQTRSTGTSQLPSLLNGDSSKTISTDISRESPLSVTFDALLAEQQQSYISHNIESADLQHSPVVTNQLMNQQTAIATENTPAIQTITQQISILNTTNNVFEVEAISVLPNTTIDDSQNIPEQQIQSLLRETEPINTHAALAHIVRQTLTARVNMTMSVDSTNDKTVGIGTPPTAVFMSGLEIGDNILSNADNITPRVAQQSQENTPEISSPVSSSTIQDIVFTSDMPVQAIIQELLPILHQESLSMSDSGHEKLTSDVSITSQTEPSSYLQLSFVLANHSGMPLFTLSQNTQLDDTQNIELATPMLASQQTNSHQKSLLSLRQETSIMQKAESTYIASNAESDKDVFSQPQEQKIEDHSTIAISNNLTHEATTSKSSTDKIAVDHDRVLEQTPTTNSHLQISEPIALYTKILFPIQQQIADNTTILSDTSVLSPRTEQVPFTSISRSLTIPELGTYTTPNNQLQPVSSLPIDDMKNRSTLESIPESFTADSSSAILTPTDSDNTIRFQPVSSLPIDDVKARGTLESIPESFTADSSNIILTPTNSENTIRFQPVTSLPIDDVEARGTLESIPESFTANSSNLILTPTDSENTIRFQPASSLTIDDMKARITLEPIPKSFTADSSKAILTPTVTELAEVLTQFHALGLEIQSVKIERPDIPVGKTEQSFFNVDTKNTQQKAHRSVVMPLEAQGNPIESSHRADILQRSIEYANPSPQSAPVVSAAQKALAQVALRNYGLDTRSHSPYSAIVNNAEYTSQNTVEITAPQTQNKVSVRATELVTTRDFTSYTDTNDFVLQPQSVTSPDGNILPNLSISSSIGSGQKKNMSQKAVATLSHEQGTSVLNEINNSQIQKRIPRADISQLTPTQGNDTNLSTEAIELPLGNSITKSDVTNQPSISANLFVRTESLPEVVLLPHTHNTVLAQQSAVFSPKNTRSIDRSPLMDGDVQDQIQPTNTNSPKTLNQEEPHSSSLSEEQSPSSSEYFQEQPRQYSAEKEETSQTFTISDTAKQQNWQSPPFQHTPETAQQQPQSLQIGHSTVTNTVSGIFPAAPKLNESPFQYNVPIENFSGGTYMALRSMPWKDGSQARIILTPGSLGTVVVQLQLNDVGNTLQLDVDSLEARRIIEQELPSLHEQLRQSGIAMNDIRVQVAQKDSPLQSSASKDTASSMNNFTGDQSRQNQRDDREARSAYLRSLTKDEQFSTRSDTYTSNRRSRGEYVPQNRTNSTGLSLGSATAFESYV